MRIALGAYRHQQNLQQEVIPRIVVSVEHQDGSASTGDASNPRPFSLSRGQLGVSYRAQELVEEWRNILTPTASGGNLIDWLRCNQH